jgi:chemotaxis protein methyltransferase CheR
MNKKNDLEAIEVKLFLEGIFLFYGYDFREYAKGSIMRRIRQSMKDENVDTISSLQEKILHNPSCMERFLTNISINTTAMFRDPNFYLSLRKKIIPEISKLPFIRIWQAGCSTGEEAWSLAILLLEEGLYENSRIYATDMNYNVIEKARRGIFPLRVMKDYTANYIESGGKKSFSEYYKAEHESAIFQPSLQKNIVWAEHNLVTDSSFNEFHMIMCRNVMIYFNNSLQEKVHGIFHDSIPVGGFLCLGNKETINLTGYENSYKTMDEKEKIYRKIK